jgi:hypothetical protein
MSLGRLIRNSLLAAIIMVVLFAAPGRGQEANYPEIAKLPNPYKLVEGWPTLPATMNGGHWGEVIRVHLEKNGNVWVFHRCFSAIPPGHATCVGRGEENPPILEFDPAGKLIRSFGDGLFAYPHGFTVADDGNLWATDVNDEPSILGLPAKNRDGVLMGQEILKISPKGKVLMTIGKEGVSGDGNDTFDRPTGVAVAPNGDIFVSDGHYPNVHHNARIMKFSKDGKFIKSFGHLGATSPSVARRTASMWPTAETGASRFLIRMGILLRPGNSSDSPARCSWAKMTRFMSAHRFGTRKIRSKCAPRLALPKM